MKINGVTCYLKHPVTGQRADEDHLWVRDKKCHEGWGLELTFLIGNPEEMEFLRQEERKMFHPSACMLQDANSDNC